MTHCYKFHLPTSRGIEYFMILRQLNELCDKDILLIDPKREPDKAFWYVDISSVDNITKQIATPQKTLGKQASVRARQVIRENDVLVSTTRPNLNAVALVPAEFNGEICSTGFCLLRCGAELDPEYLFSFVQSQLFVRVLTELVQGALYPAVTDRQVFAQSIPWVSIEEQRRIAAQLKAQLAAVEEARQATQAQISDAKRLILTILEAAFAETIISEFVKIGDAAKTVSGTTPSRSQKDYWEPPKYPWVKTSEVVFHPITRTEEYISEKALKECSLSVLPPGTVLIAMYGQGKTRGQSALLQVPATTNQACFAILPCAAFDPEYLQFWLRHSYEVLRTQSESRGGNQPNLNGEILTQFTVPLIPRKRQEALANQIKASIEETERLQSALNQQMNDLELLPARLLAEAFGES
jgi:type I restriction enzyme S subunit